MPSLVGRVGLPDDLGGIEEPVSVRALVDIGVKSSLVSEVATRLGLPIQEERLVRFGNDAEPIRRERYACTFWPR